MLDPSLFRAIVSGRRRGLSASLARGGLRLLEVPYAAAMRWRNWRYDTARAAIHRVGVPVISVGNLTLGGTGKTPTVEWLARWLGERGTLVAIVSRGYGSTIGKANDEALELAAKLPDVPQVLDADRVRGARNAIDRHGATVILLDDGLQHRRLHRDLNLVLVDATEPTGYGHVFPRGTLREPLSGWKRADVIVLTRCEQASPAERAGIRELVQRVAPQAIWTETSYVPHVLEGPNGAEHPIGLLTGKSVLAFCGIGNPASFRRALETCEIRVAELVEFADHHAYTPHDAAQLAERCAALGVEAAVCTSKDLVKIGPLWTGAAPLWSLVSRLQFTSGQSQLEEALQRVLAPAAS